MVGEIHLVSGQVCQSTVAKVLDTRRRCGGASGTLLGTVVQALVLHPHSLARAGSKKKYRIRVKSRIDRGIAFIFHKELVPQLNTHDSAPVSGDVVLVSLVRSRFALASVRPCMYISMY